ncbi:unnamed protein product [Moneuplotes crassus]|uniref:Leucine-rich repeat-containing protein n=1 Tax=Euplotes crassus TaxID=5936 RepID=A0AAD1Y6R2_EUPCR|nr:unnamed protein product [Moneuplotes crassus]
MFPNIKKTVRYQDSETEEDSLEKYDHEKIYDNIVLKKIFISEFDPKERNRGKSKTDRMLEKLHFDMEYVKNIYRVKRIKGSFSKNVVEISPKKVRRKSRRLGMLKSNNDLGLSSLQYKSLTKSHKELKEAQEGEENNAKKRLKKISAIAQNKILHTQGYLDRVYNQCENDTFPLKKRKNYEFPFLSKKEIQENANYKNKSIIFNDLVERIRAGSKKLNEFQLKTNTTDWIPKIIHKSNSRKKNLINTQSVDDLKKLRYKQTAQYVADQESNFDKYSSLENLYNKVEEHDSIIPQVRMNDTSTLFFGNKTRDEYFEAIKNDHSEEKDAPFFKYINLCKEKGILPIPKGFAQKKESIGEIDLNNSLMGDDYAEVFAETLKFKKNKYSLSLKNNRLSQESANKIVEHISSRVEKLDLSYNPLIKDLNTDALFKNLGGTLKELNLEANNVGDKLCEKISNCSQRLEHLNLSKNLITKKGATSVAQILYKSCFIVCLNLSWNNIQAKGGMHIFESLKENQSLQILDLSFNPIGNYGEKDIKHKNKGRRKKVTPQTVSRSLSEMFAENQTLRHCNFSNCRFSENQCDEISIGLNQNHTIFGLHMVGNEMNTNALGFLVKGKGESGASHFTPNLSKIEHQKGKIQSKHALKVNSNCWICEGWTQRKVEFCLSDLFPKLLHSLKKDDKMYIHYSFDDYEPDLLTLDEETERYFSIRMMPPKVNKYYISVNNEIKYASKSLLKKLKPNSKKNMPVINIIDLQTSEPQRMPTSFFINTKCHPRPSRAFLESENLSEST